MTHDEIRRRAINAESILNNDVFNDIFGELKSSYLSQWENSPEKDTESREMLYNRVKAIQEIKREFVKLLNAKRILDKE